MVFKRIIAAVLAAAVAVGTLMTAPAEALVLRDRLYDQRYAALTKALYADTETVEAVEELELSVVFLSVSDGKKQARVAEAHSVSLDSALTEAYAKIRNSGIDPKWLKLDVVVSEKNYTYKDFRKEFTNALQGSFRYGAAFGGDYTTSLLEAQINSCGLLDYTNGTFNWVQVNKELQRNGITKLKYVPTKMTLFKTQGYFCENGGSAIKLINGQYNNYGRRDLGTDPTALTLLAERTAEYFTSICDNTGKFKYGWYPINDEEMEDYNIIRHAGACWNLVMLYDMTGDERIVPVIESSLAYLKKSVVYKDRNTAFIKDSYALSVGGNGLALLAYCNYALTLGSTKYNSLIKALANGILFMQKRDGSYTHLLYPETYTVAQDYVIVYYDGEASYGLIKAYEVLGTQKYLDAAQKAADCFIAKHYETLNSHWISYMFNELTKYIPEEKYFEFGLKNMTENNWLKKLSNSKAGKNSSNEAAGAAFELYDRLVSGGYECEYLEQFNGKLLVDTVSKRVEYGLNYFMFPEYSMYFKDPPTLTNSFAVREDFFRVRIDDVQHFMDGYYLYWKNYDRIMQYTEQFEQEENNKAA